MHLHASEPEHITSEQLHNRNCYAYLKALEISPDILASIETFSVALAEALREIHQPDSAYRKYVPYGDLYCQFFSVVEANIETIFDKKREALLNRSITPEDEIEKLQALDKFIFSIYANANDILLHTFSVIQHIPLAHAPIKTTIEKTIAKHLRDNAPRVNQSSSPAQTRSLHSRFMSVFGDNFKPQHTTSLATIRNYSYSSGHSLTEYRFGTQGQREAGIERVSPLFERWLQVQKRLHSKDKAPGEITHIYINNLGLDRNRVEGKKERALTMVLQELETRHDNIAVITLPADQGLMDQSIYRYTSDRLSYQHVYDELLQIANQDPANERKVKDFYISKKIRHLIFKDEEGNYSEEAEKTCLKRLLNKSFKALGITAEQTISSAQRQAVWFHFIKFELTAHIVQTLAPKSINFSCKDAIDRGGVSSLYYNLIKSITLKNPMSRSEFECGLHAAPSMVKARGMNHNLNVLWNTINAYVNANYNDLKKNVRGAWLIEWRDLNCPHERVNDLLELRIRQTVAELEDALIKQHPKKQGILRGLQILQLIQQQHHLGVSGNRLLLETVALTPQIIFQPTKANKTRYYELAEQLSISYPPLKVLGGLMKTLAGILLYPLSLGYTKEWIIKGIATTQSGLDARTRQAICRNLKGQIDETSATEDTSDTSENTSLLVRTLPSS